MINLPKGTETIRTLMSQSEKYYLVGGAVRDALISDLNHDLDLVCTGDTRVIARKLADQVDGAFYVMDDERNTCRVISTLEDGTRLVYDFSKLRGQSIEEDLLERDFTINAMAIDLHNPVKIIDPLKGGRDLAEKWLKICKPTSFVDDPLRVIRAFRYAVKYDLRIDKNTLTLMRMSVNQLQNVSKERRRDELFKVLQNPKPWVAISLMAQYQLLPYFFIPEIQDQQTTLKRLRFYVDLDSWWSKSRKKPNPENLLFSSLITAFNHINGELRIFFFDSTQNDRSRLSLNLLCLLLWDENEINVDAVGAALVLSNEETNHIRLLLKHKANFLVLADAIEASDSRTIYRYFKILGSQGVDLVFLTLAVIAGQPISETNDKKWIRLLEIGQLIIDIWMNHPEVVYPKPLLNGKELMFEFDLPQGPIIGSLIEAMCEEQAAGLLQSKEQARYWVENRLQRGFLDTQTH